MGPAPTTIYHQYTHTDPSNPPILPHLASLSESHTVVQRLVFISIIVLFIIINHLWTAGPCYSWPPCTMQCPFHALIVQEHFQLFDSSIDQSMLTTVCISSIDSCPIASTLKAMVGWPVPKSWLKMVNDDENGQYRVWQRWQRRQDGGEDDDAR